MGEPPTYEITATNNYTQSLSGVQKIFHLPTRFQKFLCEETDSFPFLLQCEPMLQAFQRHTRPVVGLSSFTALPVPISYFIYYTLYKRSSSCAAFSHTWFTQKKWWMVPSQVKIFNNIFHIKFSLCNYYKQKRKAGFIWWLQILARSLWILKGDFYSLYNYLFYRTNIWFPYTAIIELFFPFFQWNSYYMVPLCWK